MRIAVNASLYPVAGGYRAAGVARYIQELILRLSEADSEDEFVFFAPPTAAFPHATQARVPTQNPLVRIAWEQCALPVHLKRRTISLLHSPVNVAPQISTTPGVVTLHDLSFVKFPDRFVRSKRWYQRMLSGRSAQTARRVIVPSESAREDAIEAFHLDPDRVMVIPHGVGTEFASSDDATLPPIEGPYVLYVGTIEPRKNIPLLIKAFNQFRREGFPHKLVLAGGRGWMYDEVERQIAEAAAKDSIVVTEYVKDLVPWYNHADFFVYPSVYEGFGFPPLEAMACGTPAVVSSIRALRELAGDSALYFDPTSIEDLVNLMTLVASNPGERARLAAAGLERASHFTWEETVRKTVEVYRVAVNDG